MGTSPGILIRQPTVFHRGLSRSAALLLLTFLFLLNLEAKTQSHLYTWKADYAGQWFGRAVASAGDVNADGFDDLVAGSDWDVKKSVSGDGVRVYSGRDGSLVFSMQMQNWGPSAVSGVGDLNGDGYSDIVFVRFNAQSSRHELSFISGKAKTLLRTVSLAGFRQPNVLARGGDVNKDGYPDLLIGDPTYGSSFGGRVAVISGKDGTFIHDLKQGGPNRKFFGSACASAGDVDLDGHADFLVGDPSFGSLSSFQGPGRAWLYSGRTGKVLFTYVAPNVVLNKYLSFGISVAAAGDMNLDGVMDVVIGGPGYSVNGVSSGASFLYSGKSGMLLRAYYGKQAWDYLGASMTGVGDWNGDRYPDLAISATGDSTRGLYAGAVVVYSGRDASILTTIYGAKQNSGFGYPLWRAADLDRDGVRELLIGSSRFVSSGPAQIGYFQAWSPASKSLWSDTHLLSLAKQGKQTLQLDAGKQHAGSTYFLLGSMSGIAPGLQLGAHLLPLQVDSYFWLTASVPNSSFLQGSLGVLDSKGQAQASFTAVAGMPASLVGQRADHAYLVFGKSGFAMTSNWVPLLFTK